MARTLVTDAREVVGTCAGINIRLAARRISRFLDARISESELSAAQFGLMAQIAAAPDDTIGALAERAGLDQSTLSRNLRGLERAGLVEIAIVEKDLRRRAVWLTEEGAWRLQAAIPAWRRAHLELAGLIDLAGIGKLAEASAALPDGGVDPIQERAVRGDISEARASLERVGKGKQPMEGDEVIE